MGSFNVYDSPKMLAPASTSPLQSLHISWPSLILCYTSGKARVFDIPSAELRRSVSEQVALADVTEASWRSFELQEDSAAGKCLRIDLRKALLQATRRQASPHSSPRAQALETNSHDLVKVLLRSLLIPGLSKTVDTLISNLLPAFPRVCPVAALPSHDSISLLDTHLATSPWRISRHATTYRLLAIVALTRLFLHSTDQERAASELIVYFTTFLSERIGSDFQKPSLSLILDYWYDPEGLLSHA